MSYVYVQEDLLQSSPTDSNMRYTKNNPIDVGEEMILVVLYRQYHSIYK